MTDEPIRVTPAQLQRMDDSLRRAARHPRNAENVGILKVAALSIDAEDRDTAYAAMATAPELYAEELAVPVDKRAERAQAESETTLAVNNQISTLLDY